ncbi:hypothetical protein C8R45DRAFT_335029 [Mycena sanguinolenta]|nr:hypothetical protein C8R45DRAFT_335029 [Mycena sanguinolenta]
MEEQCIRIIYVQFRDPTSLIGAALTCHSPEERLRPKPPPQHRKGSKSKPRTSKSIRYYHPFTELGFGLIRHRRRVYQRCGKDITRLVWRREGHPDEFVGGVRFKVFSKKVLSRLRDNHRRVKICAIRRSDDMEAWSFGDMTGKGSRQASGGYDGDIYGPFASESGSTPDDIRALMCLATGADVLAEAGTSIFPPLKRNLKALTESAGLNHLGRYGISSFYCHNYISCVHEDPDNSAEDVEAGRGRTTGRGGQFPCVQLTKSGCSKNSYNFAYTAFGQVIQTRSNTVWLFNGRHAHATTVMPSQREVNRRARSEGWHDTAPGAAVVRARRLRMIRCGYNLRPRVV